MRTEVVAQTGLVGSMLAEAAGTEAAGTEAAGAAVLPTGSARRPAAAVPLVPAAYVSSWDRGAGMIVDGLNRPRRGSSVL